MTGSLRIIDHPLVATRLSIMRDVRTDKAGFRSSLNELTTLLVYEALRNSDVEINLINTPLALADGVQLRRPIIFVPILRAGLGMLDAAVKLVPDADIGFVGMARDEQTHQPTSYLESLPESLEDKRVVILDPMLATGGSLISCLEALATRGAIDITVVCALSAPEGISRVHEFAPNLDIVTASVDQRLDDNAYIVPGLGDAGDRQFGAV